MLDLDTLNSMKHLILVLLIIGGVELVKAQNTIGLPYIHNYTKQQYQAGTQSWSIRQDKKGIMYFANNEGLLTFDGSFWRRYALPNKTKVRSLEFGTDNRLYAGGENEFGYYKPNASGDLSFVSLKNLVSEKEHSFSDIWNVCGYQKSVFFRASNKIFQYRDNKVSIYRPQSHWRFMGATEQYLLAQDFEKGLLKFNQGCWETFLKTDDFSKKSLITALVPVNKDSALVVTLEHGAYWLRGNQTRALSTDFMKKVAKYRIYNATRVSHDRIALSTSLNGCFIINKKGEFIQHYSKDEGLINNNVLSNFIDNHQNLWLGLDNGIAFVATNNAIKNIYPKIDNEGAGYASAIYQNKLYLGTSNGLFVAPLGQFTDLSYVKAHFSAVPNSTGQVWGLNEINGKLLMGHHEGAFVVNPNQATKLLDNGYWSFLPLGNIMPASFIVAGNYNGLSFFKYQNNTFVPAGQVPNFHISSRFICLDHHNEKVIWTSHPYQGVFKITLKEGFNADIKLYSEKQGLTLSLNNSFVYAIKNRVVVASEKGLFEYNDRTDKFEESVYLKKYFGKLNVYYLKEDSQGNIWFIANNKLGVLDLSGKQPKIIYLPELTNKMVAGFESINPIDAQNILVGSERGFFHINYNAYKLQQNNVNVNIRAVAATGKADSLFFGGYWAEINTLLGQQEQQIPRIASSFNGLGFEFSSTLFNQQETIEYAYLLDGFDKTWSGWSKKTSKEYSQLPAGTYTFKVKARNNFGKESPVAMYTFVILPPWYLTIWAYLVYTLLLMGMFYWLFLWQQQKFIQQQLQYQEEQKRLLYLHQLELEQSEKEIVSLRNEKLEAEIIHKNADLASSAMHLVQKAELLSKLKHDLSRMAKTENLDEMKEDLRKMIKVVDDENTLGEDWSQFSVHFDSVHSNFLVLLKEKFPNLSPSELKLCAYLRMNLSTKEIAQLMNISSRSVEVSRYRLRKKLQLPSEVNFFNYFLSIKE